MKQFFNELLLLLGFLVAISVILSLYTPMARADVSDYKLHAVQMEKEYALPSGMLVAICEQESHWRNVAGRHGEIGVCQVKPTTVAMICPECKGNAKKKLFFLGTKGDEVARIQAVLARDKYYQAAIDGVYGPQTHKAVLGYQLAEKLVVDGLVGPKTWAKLFGVHDPFPGHSISESLWNPHENIEWAARYLVWLRENVTDDPMVMLAAYNGGPGNPVVVYMKRVRERMKDNEYVNEYLGI
jgi:hypothetical protein